MQHWQSKFSTFYIFWRPHLSGVVGLMDRLVLALGSRSNATRVNPDQSLFSAYQRHQACRTDRRHAQHRFRTLATSADDATPSQPLLPTPPTPPTTAGANAALPSLLDAFTVPDSTMARVLGLNDSYLQTLMELPGTTTVADLKSRLVALSQWNDSLRRGVLPRADGVDWPQEPFRSKFLDVLKKLEMPRFTRRHPKLLASLLQQFLQLVQEFEAELLDEEAKKQSQKPPPQQQPPQQQQQQQNPGGGGDQESEESDGQGNSEGSGEQDAQDAEKQEGRGAAGEGEKSEIKVQLDDVEGGQADGSPQQGEGEDASDQSGFAERLAEEMLKKFEDKWSPAMEALDVASQAFEDVDGLLEGPEGFDNASSVWHSSGWREVDALRRRLESLRELRDLVRSLGRGGGKGPLKKAPQMVWSSKHPPGVVRSPQSPEETRGLTRSGDLSRMLPAEAHLLAAGWPRRSGRSDASSSGAPADGGAAHSSGEGPSRDGGSRACRMLFMARRAERMLMSYERTGWVEDEPARATGRMEVRPAAELGPIIVCLDTSGSMNGAREVVAKALTLECMRGAHRQGRRCYLYAFSGPGDVMDLELGTDAASMTRLLGFLTMSFTGGTDVDAPLALSLERLGREEWTLADILMVTDGEIPSPNEDILSRLRVAQEDLGLQVHGLLVGRNITEPMKQLCTNLHVFKSWSAVEGTERFMGGM